MIILVIHLVYKKLIGKNERVAKFPKIPKWLYPLIIICILAYIYVCILTIIYIFNPILAFNVFLPIEVLNIDLLKYIGCIFVITGTIIIMVAYFTLNKSKKINLDYKSESRELKTIGIYAISRNPMYLGMHVLTIGFAIIMPTWITFSCIIIFIINFHYRIKLEEKELEESFGNNYIAYKRNVFRYLGRRRKKSE